ncbi:MAG: hypothetical protein ACI4D7_01070 [Lachnospiraceae bacterium]
MVAYKNYRKTTEFAEHIKKNFPGLSTEAENIGKLNEMLFSGYKDCVMQTAFAESMYKDTSKADQSEAALMFRDANSKAHTHIAKMYLQIDMLIELIEALENTKPFHAMQDDADADKK